MRQEVSKTMECRDDARALAEDTFQNNQMQLVSLIEVLVVALADDSAHRPEFPPQQSSLQGRLR
ncbi:hypothetical protein F444_21407 [Phytophthora nicotianae P1976]|uniref:Uncharacterized protein n=1 Tax=Phytophthora nicotianae P1976 TaxID=1317066 RepID=A0A080Z171_PHYNI|nr:hypothetical protein F444_21407 [Phytophthora nicotianae P1976]